MSVIEMDALDLNPGPVATEVMARLTAMGLDAALSEGRGCMVLRRGKKILPFLKRLDPASALAGCGALLYRSRENAGEFPDVEPGKVCNTEADIARIRDEYIRRIEAGEACWPWLFN